MQPAIQNSHIYNYLLHGIETLWHEDPDLFDILEREHERQLDSLTLVASCGGTDTSVLAVSGASIVNVTAEGYPGNRYHAGCRYVDQAEQLAIDRAKRVFGAHFVNVQPHCASNANHIVMQAVMQPGDAMIGMALDHGGHLTHGAPANLSGRLFEVHSYGLDADGFIHYAELQDLAQRHRPRLIVCGTTSYTRKIDFARIRSIADSVGAYVLADITHIAGLVATGLHPTSIGVAHFTTTCTFKQLYGPRGGLIMMGEDADSIRHNSNKTLAQAIQSAVFPLVQGSPAVETIAAKARALARLQSPDFHALAQRIRDNADALAAALNRRGYHVIGGGTDNHIVLFEVPEHLSGMIAEKALEACGIIVNKNKLPNDKRAATVTSGIRLGSNTVSLRGMGPAEMEEAVELVDIVLKAARSASSSEFELPEEVQTHTSGSVRALCRRFPLPYDVVQ